MAIGAAIGDGKGLAVVFLDIVDRDQQGTALAGNEAPRLKDDARTRELLMEIIEQRRKQLFELGGIELCFVFVVLDTQAATHIDHAHVQFMAFRQGAEQAENVRGVIVDRLRIEDLGAVIDVNSLDPDVGQRQVLGKVGHCGVFLDTEVSRPPAHLPG
ncbi:hypothetical protein D3C81_1460360 [compost metagenome]